MEICMQAPSLTFLMVMCRQLLSNLTIIGIFKRDLAAVVAMCVAERSVGAEPRTSF
jgi:hypothetical protein